MKNFSKFLTSVVILSLFIGFSTKAATGDSVGTGTVSTGATLYSGDIMGYLTGQKIRVSNLFDATYNKIYTDFTQTGLNIMRSIGYQSLVCLWAIKSDSLISQLQNDKTSFKIAFNKDFVDLESQILGLEEKNRIQTQNGVIVFDSGTTYDTEKTRIKDTIDTKVQIYKGLINNFQSNYATKNADFLSTYLQYIAANQNLIQGITNKMAGVQQVIDAFSGVDAIVQSINSKITGLDDLIQKMDDTKSKGIGLLNMTLQPFIDTNVKKYKKLQNLEDALIQQKALVIGKYSSDLNWYLSNNLQNRYNRTAYNDLKSQVNNFQSTFYTANGILNCSSILSSADTSAWLLSKIAIMNTAVSSGLANITANGVSADFKNQLFSGFQTVYIQQYKQRYNEYLSFINDYLATALRNLTNSAISTTVAAVTTGITQVVATIQKAATFAFKKAFQDNAYSPDIKTLQTTLTSLGLYSWAIDGIYSKVTKAAVYQFQLSKGLLKGYEKKPSVWWFFWPATRKAMNNVLK